MKALRYLLLLDCFFTCCAYFIFTERTCRWPCENIIHRKATSRGMHFYLVIYHLKQYNIFRYLDQSNFSPKALWAQLLKRLVGVAWIPIRNSARSRLKWANPTWSINSLICQVTTRYGTQRRVWACSTYYTVGNFGINFCLGAAFAATTLAEKASDQLKPFLPSLVPKLYRYSYDPNTRVATVRPKQGEGGMRWSKMAWDGVVRCFDPILCVNLGDE